MPGRGGRALRGDGARGGPSSGGGGPRGRGRAADNALPSKRPRNGGLDPPGAPPTPPRDAESEDSRTPPRAPPGRVVQPMRGEDIAAIADALFTNMKPAVTQLITGLLEPVITVASTNSRALAGPSSTGGSGGTSVANGGATAGTPLPVGLASSPFPESTRVVIREELDAFEERRQPGLDMRQGKTVKAVTDAVEKKVIECLNEKPVDLMTDDEINQAVLKALPTRSIRQHHGPVLNETIKMLMEDPRYKGEAFTSSFPPSSPLLETLVNEAFNKIVLGIVQRVYNSNAEIPVEKQPHVFKGKDVVSPGAMDRVDRSVGNLIRTILHDPRCKTRRLAVVLFLYYFFDNAGDLKLKHPQAVKPSVTDGAGAAYFDVQIELLASCSGLLPKGDIPAPRHKQDARDGSPLAGVHKVRRDTSLYAIALKLLLKLVREAFKFDPEVVFSVADTLRAIVIDPDRRWTTMDHKEADEIHKTKTWTLLLPRADVQADASQAVQTLTPKEKDTIQAKHLERERAAQPPAGARSGEGAAAGSTGPGGSASGNPVPSTQASSASTDWLRRLAR